MGDETRNGPTSERKGNLRYVAAFVGLAVPSVLGIWSIVAAVKEGRIADLAQPQYRITFGVPLAVLVAVAIVTLFRTAEGPIKFEALGFKFEGASGEIVMWVVCFLALTLAMTLLWPAVPSSPG